VWGDLDGISSVGRGAAAPGCCSPAAARAQERGRAAMLEREKQALELKLLERAQVLIACGVRDAACPISTG
jgi:hypothetical protein